MAWLTDYWLTTPGTELGDNPTVRLDLDSEFVQRLGARE